MRGGLQLLLGDQSVSKSGVINEMFHKMRIIFCAWSGVCVCVFDVGGIEKIERFRFGKAFVGITQHTVPHAPRDNHPSHQVRPTPHNYILHFV